ncbi:MAG: cob(I)yrinic acid a,c-diamide adenosyltransferase [Tissierellia bacterium]|jgi:cob(I)alamin adenosyltransferase|nr:cob(I)yrinic acid a,c-diamide adenosyltransferase [Tissierellia bacterium]
MDKGYIHIYTGKGKGKTTAAFGLALRAALSGKKVFIGQFVKNMEYNETKIANYLSNIEIKQLGRGCFINEDPEEADIEIAKKALDECSLLLSKGEYDLIILDEINIALYYKLLKVSDVVSAIKNKAHKVEVVLTGRYAPEELIEMADLVTEMVEIKHYYSQGVISRNGIDC